MPYTPPGRSPADSRPQTPRSNSSQYFPSTPPKHGPSNNLPHSSSSTSYLAKHRRSPSLSRPDQTTNGLTQNGLLLAAGQTSAASEGPHSLSDRMEQSEDSVGSPSGSPPSSSDDEPGTSRGRMRDVSNLAELQAAIRIIEQHRQGSPDDEGQTFEARMKLGLPEPRMTPKAKVNGAINSETLNRPPLSQTARKISHSRSSTESSAFLDFPRNKFDSPGQSRSVSDMDDDDEEEEAQSKPALIRKKSGELVRPALRASSTRRRPSSMPGTPTYSKAVHFQDNSLEHVRHFLQVDRPIAVSAGSSPVETYDDDTEFPFNEPHRSLPAFDWEIKLPNFPPEHSRRPTEPVKIERVYLSTDNKILIGAIAVRNLAFHKLVVARFTLDYWKTTSEVVAEYNNDVRRKLTTDGYDRFTFSIKLEDQANLEEKTMFFCVRYNVNGREYWDNNNSRNYQVDFAKKFKCQNGKSGGSRPLNSLPRSRPSTEVTPKMRPRSMPSFDDFASTSAPYDISTFPDPSKMVGETPIKFRNKQSQGSSAPDRNSTNQQAFGNRYDFGASLSAAIQQASKEMGERSGPRSDRSPPEGAPLNDNQAKQAGAPSAAVTNPTASEPNKPKALTSEKPSLQSPSYHELLDKYCFVRSRPDLGQKVPAG